MRVSFHGATDEVTGSCILVEAADTAGVVHRMLFDCGMIQGERICGSKNFEPFGFDPKMIEAVFITHPHADHTGRLPKLIKEGYAGEITMVRPCLSLTRLVLEDAYHIMKGNTRHCSDPMLYVREDLDLLISRCVGIGYHQAVDVAPGIRIMFHDAGHVLGSAYISIDAEGKRLVVSGDIGNDEVPILPPTEPMSHADVVICESTYGNRIHESHEERRKKLMAAIEHSIAQKGVLMIPSFSIERTQELLFELDQILLRDLKTNIPIYLDSPMAIRATEIYRSFSDYLEFSAKILSEPDRDFFSFPNLHETLTTDESKMVNEAPSPKVIIAGAGMMTGGRIMHHLQRYLSDPKNCLLIIGYVGAGTLGRQIFDGAKEVMIYGQKVEVKAEVMAIGAFSAHGDRNKLTRWVKPTEGPLPKKIFLVHGDPDAKTDFASHLRRTYKTDVVIPTMGEGYMV